MSIMELLQELDDLILQNTKQPVTHLLRRKVQEMLEQTELHADVSEQLEALKTVNARLVAENAALRLLPPKEPANAVKGYPCPFCYHEAATLLKIAIPDDHPVHKQLGIKHYYYHCPECNNDWDDATQ
jgi:hypothetical protein